MVLDTLSRSAATRGLSPRLDTALNWLAQFDPATPDGRYPIAGDDVFALVQSYETVPAADKRFETHRMYADVQYIAAGTETIRYAPADGLSPVTDYDAPKDFQLFADPVTDTPLHLEPGAFAVFFPHDAHKPGCAGATPSRVKKVVVKVRV